MKISNHHNRKEQSMRILKLDDTRFFVHSGDFTTSQIVRNVIAKIKRGTIKVDSNKEHIVVDGGVFEPATVRQF